MSRFKVCAHVALGASGARPSHAWIALHRCAESLARLTGEPFTSIMTRLGEAHGFGREPERWPDAAQIRTAAAELVVEREAWLSEYRGLVAARVEQKARGDRRRGGRLGQLEAARRRHNAAQARVGYWGWRAQRRARDRD